MAEENQKNTIATIGMWFSIVGLVLSITGLGLPSLLIGLIVGIFGWFSIVGWTLLIIGFGLPLLFIGLILGIIGLFSKPRIRARIAVIIPLVVFVIVNWLVSYAWKSVEIPVNEFMDWAKPQLEQLESENFDEDRFERLLNVEFNKITNDKTEDDWKLMFDASTGSNFLEKGSYLFFSVIRQSMETALEKYNNGEVVEIDEENVNNIIDVDIDIEDDENDIDDEDDDIDDDIEETEQQKETVVVQPKKSNNGTFSQSEKNDIEQILDILE